MIGVIKLPLEGLLVVCLSGIVTFLIYSSVMNMMQLLKTWNFLR